MWMQPSCEWRGGRSWQQRIMFELFTFSWLHAVMKNPTHTWPSPAIVIHFYRVVALVWTFWVLYQLSITALSYVHLPQQSATLCTCVFVIPCYTSEEICVSSSALNIFQVYLDFLKEKQMEPIISRSALITQLAEPGFSLQNIKL